MSENSPEEKRRLSKFSNAARLPSEPQPPPAAPEFDWEEAPIVPRSAPPLSKYSNADRSAYSIRSNPPSSEGAPSLSSLIETVVKERMLDGEIEMEGNRLSNLGFGSADEEDRPRKLLEELRAAQQRSEAELFFTSEQLIPTPAPPALVEAEPQTRRRSALGLKALRKLGSLFRIGGRWGMARGRFGWRQMRRAAGAMRYRDWHRRYFRFLAFVHRRLSDRQVEQLLFIKSAEARQDHEQVDAAKRSLLYTGPLPQRVLTWALSALPDDLKRFAFVDFRAGNGRTLLLAARRNFEHAVGYTFDAKSCEELEMNLAQYPRSYMSCRDVRAVRGDERGVEIPMQPVVLFLPHGMRSSHVEIIMSNIAASYLLYPREMYVIFENLKPGFQLQQTDIFVRCKLPLINRIKLWFFSPARIAVFKSVQPEAVA